MYFIDYLNVILPVKILIVLNLSIRVILVWGGFGGQSDQTTIETNEKYLTEWIQ